MKDGSPKKYHMTTCGIKHWFRKEIDSVGYLAGVKDPDLQYSWAQSLVNGMLHLRDALYELVNDPAYKREKEELTRMHDKLVRVVKHVIKEYKVNLNTIKRFNTRHVLGPTNYLKNRKTRTRMSQGSQGSQSSRSSRKTRRNNALRNVDITGTVGEEE